MHAPHSLFEPLFNKYRSTRNLECEFRIGRKNNKFFDTNVGDDTFFALKKALDKFKDWEKIEADEYEVYTGTGGKRTIIDSNDNRHSEIKTPLEKIDFVSKDLPFDIRMSLATETPSEPREEDVFERMRTKARTSYFRKGLRIDISVVTGNPDDHDARRIRVTRLSLRFWIPSQSRVPISFIITCTRLRISFRVSQILQKHTKQGFTFLMGSAICLSC